MGLLRLAMVAVALVALSSQASAQLFQYATDPPTFTVPSYPNTPSNVTINLGSLSSNPSIDENLDASGTGTDILFGNITVTGLNHNFTGAVISTPIPFDFQITINDFGASNFGPPGVSLPLGSATYDVSGTLSGTIGPGNKMQITASAYTITPTSQQVGSGDDYLLSNSYFIPPSPGLTGGFGIHVTATTHNIPEPATLTLLGLGAAVLAVPTLRRWRSSAAPAAQRHSGPAHRIGPSP